MEKLAQSDLNEYKSLDNLEANTPYIFSGVTAKGNQFFTTGHVRTQKEEWNKETESYEKVKIKEIYLDHEMYGETPEIKKYLKLEY